MTLFCIDIVSTVPYVLSMIFTWDPAKAASNMEKHGVSFDDAKEVFSDPLHLSILDQRFSYLEERWITIGKIKIILYRLLGKIKKQASQDIGSQKDIKRYSNHQASLLLNQIPKIRKYDEHREKIAKIYDEVLNEDFVFQKHSKCLLRYPVLLSNPAEVLAALSKERIIGGRWYSSVVFPLSENFERVGYIKGSCVKAELCSKYVINLPTGIEVSEELAKDIAKIVNKTGISIKI